MNGGGMMMRVSRVRGVGAGMLLAVLLAACVDPREREAELRTPIRVTLTDSVVWRGRTLRRPVVSVGARSDTIIEVLIDRPPATVPGTGAVGVYVDTARAQLAGYIYDTRHHRVRRFALPSDAAPLTSAAAVSPDGEHVAYAARAGDSLRATVRLWPAGEIVATGPAVPAADARAAWTSPDSFSVDIGATRFRGSASAHKVWPAP